MSPSPLCPSPARCPSAGSVNCRTRFNGNMASQRACRWAEGGHVGEARDHLSRDLQLLPCDRIDADRPTLYCPTFSPRPIAALFARLRLCNSALYLHFNSGTHHVHSPPTPSSAPQDKQQDPWRAPDLREGKAARGSMWPVACHDSWMAPGGR